MPTHAEAWAALRGSWKGEAVIVLPGQRVNDV
jgi:hypothetical protein